LSLNVEVQKRVLIFKGFFFDYVNGQEEDLAKAAEDE